MRAVLEGQGGSRFKNDSKAVIDAAEVARKVGMEKRGDITEWGEKLLKDEAKAKAERIANMRMSPSVPYLMYPPQLEGWVGGEKGFDPLMVTDALPVYWVREAELKHARVCMLATVGWIATDLGLRFPGEQFQVTTLQAHDAMVENGIFLPFLAAIGTAELYSGWLWIQGWTGEANREAGDYFLGKQFLPKDPEKAKDMRLKELENGRLAMLAFSGIVTQAAAFKATWPFA